MIIIIYLNPQTGDLVYENVTQLLKSQIVPRARIASEN